MEPHVLHIIRDGRHTWLWLDQWHYDGILMKLYGEGIRHSLRQSRDCKVAEILINGAWNPRPIGSHLLSNMWASLSTIKKLPGDCNDTVVWKADLKGIFSIKTAWSLLKQHTNLVRWFNVVWCPGFIPKHSFVSWHALHGKLQTQTLLRRYGIVNISRCCSCWNHSKDLEHLCFTCSFTSKVWIQLLKLIRPTHKKARPLGAEVEWIINFSKRLPVLCSILKLLFNATGYHIWIERNQRRFGDQVRSIKGICSDVFGAVLTRSSKFKASVV